MKQEHQENQLSETLYHEIDAAARASASETWVFWSMVVHWGIIGVAVLYWGGLVGFSPLDFIEWIVSRLTDTQGLTEDVPTFMAGPLSFMRELVAGVSWAALGLLWLPLVRIRVGIIEAGSVEAYRQRLREDAERTSTPTPVGVLIGVSIAKGGILSSSETLVETSEAFFRVSGLVNTVKKGDPVFTLGSQLLIGVGNGLKRYTLIS